MRRLVFGSVAAAGLYALLVRGDLSLDVGVGRSVQPLGPVSRLVAAPRVTVFDVVAEPYLGRTPRALAGKLEVWERGTDMALAAHFTPVRGGLVATTVETVRFEHPETIHFRLVRGPVPHLTEKFEFRHADEGTELIWSGELGTDFWAAGRWWGGRVALVWERAVRASFDSIAAEAERRAR
jgi:Polyketide cyclase / dehydrase and lipid transport